MFQVFTKGLLMEFSVPANTMLDDKLLVLQLFMTVSKQKCIYWLVRTVFLCSLKGCSLVPADSFSLNKEQTVSWS